MQSCAYFGVSYSLGAGVLLLVFSGWWKGNEEDPLAVEADTKLGCMSLAVTGSLVHAKAT